MEGGGPRSIADRGYLAGLVGVLGLEIAGVLYQFITGIPVPSITAFATIFVLACMLRIHGFRGTIVFVALVVAIPFASEFLGVLTGIPYGSYSYTGMRPWLFDLVPVFILIAWIHIGYLAIATSTLALGRSSLWLAPLDGVLALAWDVMVDPLAVRAGFWVWHSPSGLYGVPLSNFLGWWLVVTLLSLAARSVWARDRTAPVRISRTMGRIVPPLLLGSGAAFAALAVEAGLPLSALVGLVVLAPATGIAWYRIGQMAPGRSTPSPWVRPALRLPASRESPLDRA